MPPDEPNDEEELEKLDEDNQTPFSPPDPSRDDPTLSEPDEEDQHNDSTVDKDHPSNDSRPDEQEYYDQGTSVQEPNKGNSVVDYDESEDLNK